ncbi:MAG TPA: YiiG family protein, partial [Polyangiaceae bacterium]
MWTMGYWFARSFPCAVFLCCSLADCKKLEQLQQTTAPEGAGSAAAPLTSAASAADSEEEADAQKSEKVSGYVECINRASAQVFSSRDRYLLWVDEKKGPTGKEPYAYGLYQLNADESCLSAITKASGLKPSLPAVDAAGQAYATALGALVPLIKTAYVYYDQHDYKDDKMARGKAMHAPLMGAFHSFGDASKALDDQVSKLNDELSARRLARLAKDPAQRLRYLVTEAEIQGKNLVNAADVKSIQELDEARFTALLGNFEKTLGDLDGYQGAHKPEVDKVNNFSSFYQAGMAYLKSAKELMRRKREKKDFKKESGDPESIDGHPLQV